MHRGIAGDNGAVLAQDVAAAVERRHDTTRLTNQQRAGGDVPRRQLQLPEAVQPASRDVGEVERRGAGPPDSARRADHRGELRYVDMQEIERLEWKAGADQRAPRLGDRGDAEARVLLERAPAADRPVRALATDVVNDAGRELALDEATDADGILGIAVQKVRGAIEWVDDPDQFALRRALGGQLLADDHG